MKHFNFFVLYICFVVQWNSFLKAQNVFFEKKYGQQLPDFSRAIVQLSDSTIYMLGTTEFTNDAQVTLSKLDYFGNLLWVKYYGGPNNDYGISLIAHNNSLIFVYEKESTPNNLDIGLIQTDTSGIIIESKLFGTITKNESPKQIIKTLNNQFAICGFISDNFGYNDIYVIKLDSLFQFQWDISIGGMDNDYSSGLIELPDSNFIIAGDTRSYSTGGYDIYLIKLSKNGVIMWDQAYGNSFDNGSQGIILTHDLKVFIYGETHTGIGLDFDYYTLMVDTSGTLLWQFDLGGTGTDAAFSAIELNNGNFILTGYSNSNNINQPIDLVVFIISRNGNIIWQEYFGLNGIDIGYNIIHSIDNGVIITGQTYTLENDMQQYLIYLKDIEPQNTVQLEKELNTFNAPFPNPFKNQISLSEEILNFNIEIFDLNGQTVSYQISNNKISFNEDMPQGIYFLKMQNNQNVITYKIVKY